MFNLREFVKKGLLKAIGIQSDYWVILTAANWFQKGVLEEVDLIEIQEKIDEKNNPIEESNIEEESVETTENTSEESEGE